MTDKMFLKMFPHTINVYTYNEVPEKVTVFSGLADCQLTMANLSLSAGVQTPVSMWKCFVPRFTSEDLIKTNMSIDMTMGDRVVTATVNQTYTVDLVDYRGYKYGSIIYAMLNPLT